ACAAAAASHSRRRCRARSPGRPSPVRRARDREWRALDPAWVTTVFSRWSWKNRKRTSPLPDGVVAIAQEGREQIFDHAPPSGLDLGGDRHAGLDGGRAVFGLDTGLGESDVRHVGRLLRLALLLVL